MLNYLDMEGILELYALNHETFETQEVLNMLTHRFNLPGKPKTFQELLKRYDHKYGTVRSYNRIDKTLDSYDQLQAAARIQGKAALHGNIQSVINGFKLYPDLLNSSLNDLIYQGAEGGHELIIDLILDLGGNPENNEILKGALNGGHLDLITGDKYRAFYKPVISEDMYWILGTGAIYHNQLASLKFLFSLPNYLPSVPNSLMGFAGELAYQGIIDYLISSGANDYSALVWGAMYHEHFDLVVKYLPLTKVSSWKVQNASKRFLPMVIQAGRLDILKLLVERDLVTDKVLHRGYRLAVKVQDPDIIAYLASLGADVKKVKSHKLSDSNLSS
jgi:hypothetical protein